MNEIAVVSDIHGNVLALKAVVADIEKRSIFKVINLGDHISGPLWPKETIQFLMSTNWINILGNHDRHLTKDDPTKLGLSDAYAHGQMTTKDMAWLESLPSLVEIKDDMIAFHGSPRNDGEYLLETIENGGIHLAGKEEISRKLEGLNSKIILCGHTHTPRCIVLGSAMIINPGSVGMQGYMDDSDNPHVVEIGSPHARYAIIRTDEEGIDVEFVALRYDWDKAVEKAMESKRKEWINVLKTGFVN